MSSSASPRKQAPPSSPIRGQKRKASEVNDAIAGPSRQRTASTSPYPASSLTSSPGKRAPATSSSARRNSRQARTFQISDDFDEEDEDAPYDEDLDAEGEEDEEYLEQDAEGEVDDAAAGDEAEDDFELIPGPSTSSTSARSTARPKRANAPNVSNYYAVQPLPASDDDEDEDDETPSIPRREREADLPSARYPHPMLKWTMPNQQLPQPK